MKLPCLLAATLSCTLSIPAGEYLLQSFKKIQLSDQFWSEGASFGDFNRDGKMDVVAGPFWWEGPDFKAKHEYYPATKTFELKLGPLTRTTLPGFPGALGKENAYSDNFLAFAHDLNNDTWTDILVIGFPGAETAWFENPQGKPGHWRRHVILSVTDNESPTFTDLDADGKPELVCGTSRQVSERERTGQFGYAKPDPTDPAKPWVFHAITPSSGRFQRFTHGLGIGDINGDGRLDLLEMNGWWQQPDSLANDPTWEFHPVAFAPGAGSAQMYAYDVNGDGRNDVITSLAAHGYGLAWYEQLAEKDAKGSPTFKARVIMNKEPNENKYGVSFSQLHAIDLVDMDGDGLKDIVTGKRFWAHGTTGDADPNAPALLYWFKLVRAADKSVDFIPHQIDNDSGVGTQVVADDLNGDQKPDVVIGNKKGTFVFLQETKNVSKEEWEKTQPKAVSK